MSQVYSTEPGTTGRVVFDTTHGPIDVNLWCKECPTTTRMFIQLCLDGFYDDMIWHRILDNFLIQTGLTRDETMAGTSSDDMDGYLRRSSAVPASSSLSSGADALGWERKKLELNPRIRFNHRGQVAMALPLDGESKGGNESEAETALRYQFFVTLDESPFLDAKHVIFGTISGPTIFNALRIGRTEVNESSGIPTDMNDSPPRIKSVKIDHHPFQDLVVTAEKSIPWKKATKGAGKGAKEVEQSAIEKRRKKRKGKRDLNVLSFGDEERDYDAIANRDENDKNGPKGTMQSSHDVLASESKFLSSKVDADVEKRAHEKDGIRDGSKIKPSDMTSKDQKLNVGEEESLDNNIAHDAKKNDPLQSKSPNEASVVRDKETSEQLREKSKNGRKSSKEENRAKHSETTKSNTVSQVEARRAKYLKRGTGSSATKNERLRREDDTMAKLLAFKSKVLETKGSKKSRLNDGNDSINKKQAVDDSLASRMAKRMQEEENEEELRYQEKEAISSAPGYSGQILNDDDGEKSDDDAVETGNWMGTKFKCKRHVDHDSRMTALDNIGDKGDEKDMGGDGRHMDDYLVIDGKNRGRNERKGHGHGRNHQNNKSMQHAGRGHKNPGSNRW